MGEEVKKISFGFSKFTKKTQIVSSTLNQIKPEKNNVELIDCFEGKAIKLKNPIQSVDKILVIPLQKQQENKLDLIKDDDLMRSTLAVSIVGESDSRVKIETVENSMLVGKSSEHKADSIPPATEVLTLDQIAAKEILEDLNDKKNQGESRIFTVPLTNNPPAGENESSLEDYENIPVGDFGLAMLRGMGWAPGKGIGKNEKLVTPSLPALRPKGMGLGADKVLKSPLDIKNSNEDLKMVKNSFIRVIAGQHKDLYGQIEGFDDETGRLIVKLALKSESVSLNEFMVHLVDKVEFVKNSKVINVSKYEQYKDDESKNKSDKSIKSIDNKNDKQPFVDEHDKQHKGKHYSSNPGSVNLTKLTKHKFESRETNVIPMKRETDFKKSFALQKKSNKQSNKRRSRSWSSSTSSTDLKVSKESSSKRGRSSSSSTNSEDSRRKNKKKTYKNKYKHLDSDERSSCKSKSILKRKTRSSSSSSSSSSVSSNNYIKSVYRTGMKGSSSKKYQSKRRSKSPRDRDSAKKHRNKKHRQS